MVRSVLSPRRTALLTLLVFLAFAAPAAAHEGHDHGATPAVVAAALPRTKAHTDLFEVVAVLQPGGALVITLDRYADNVPLVGAITLTLDGQELPTERQGLGLFVLRHPRLEQPGPIDLVSMVTAGEDMDLLSATLEIPAPARVAASGGAAMLELLRAGPIQLGIGVGLLAFGLLLGRASVRRPLPAMVEDVPQPVEAPVALPRRAAALALGALLFTPGAWAQQALVTGESPRRLEDGGIFVPKASQRLLNIRTQLTWLFSAMALASYSMGER